MIKKIVKRILRRKPPQKPADFLNVKDLMKKFSVEEHCKSADRYFSQLKNYDYLLAKPLINPDDAPPILVNFSKALQGLRLYPGLTILDFAAGSCWTSRFLTQLGARVIALDASARALEIGKELYNLHPVIGDRPEPEFLLFDGRRIDLPGGSVDRILCMDAFHHMPNPQEILKEMGRVLKQGGVAAFVEPGPEHSRSPQSQMEMKKFGVIENDVIMRDLWAMAQRAGFTNISFAVYGGDPFFVSLDEYEQFQKWGGLPAVRYSRNLRNELNSRNTFFLDKGAPDRPDSKSVKTLKAQLDITFGMVKAKQGDTFPVKAIITNTGSSNWLPGSTQAGGVNLGVHLLDESERTIDNDYYRMSPDGGSGRMIAPGESLALEMDVPAPAKGKYIFEFDMVSENICWFAFNGSQTARQRVEIV